MTSQKNKHNQHFLLAITIAFGYDIDITSPLDHSDTDLTPKLGYGLNDKSQG